VSWISQGPFGGALPPQGGDGWTPVGGLGEYALTDTDSQGNPELQFIGNNGETLLIQSTGRLDQEVSLAHTLLNSGY
jgi:hypothetical protein